MRTVAIIQATLSPHARHVVIAVCLVVIALCLVLAAFLAYVAFTGMGKPMRELSDRQLRRLARKGRLP